MFRIPVCKDVSSSIQSQFSALLRQVIKSAIWHPGLGHPTNVVLSSMLNKSKVFSIVDESGTMCSACIHEKLSRLHFSEKTSRSLFPFDKIHSDIWGPSPIRFAEGYKYYVTFSDDCTKFVWIFPLCNKLDVFQIFVIFRTFFFSAIWQ